MPVDKAQLRFALVVVGLVAVYAAGLMWPQVRAFRELNGRIAQAEQELGLTKGRTDGLAILAGEVDALRRAAGENNKEIPNHEELAKVLHDISVQIEAENLTGQGISTQPTVEKQDYVTLPVDLTFRGNSVSVFRFIDRIEAMPRLMQVESVNVIKNADDPSTVQAVLRLMTYFRQGEGGKA